MLQVTCSHIVDLREVKLGPGRFCLDRSVDGEEDCSSRWGKGMDFSVYESKYVSTTRSVGGYHSGSLPGSSILDGDSEVSTRMYACAGVKELAVTPVRRHDSRVPTGIRYLPVVLSIKDSLWYLWSPI